MNIDVTKLPLVFKLIFSYLLIGFCVQLPGTLYGHFLRQPRFRQYQNAPLAAKIIPGFLWLVYTIFFWPRPFFKVGFNMMAIELVGIGILSSAVIFKYCTVFWGVIIVIVFSAVISMLIARPRRLRG